MSTGLDYYEVISALAFRWGVFPDPAATIRLVGAVLLAVDDEWQAGKRYFSQQSMRQLLDLEPVIPATAIRHAPVH